MTTEQDAAAALKALGITFKSTSLLEMAYDAFKGVAMLPLATGMQLLVLDLNNLPTKPIPFKEVFIRWMMQANESRIMNGEEPILTYDLAKRCPIWKLIKMPVKSMTMSRDKIMKAPKIQTVRKQNTPKNINKGK